MKLYNTRTRQVDDFKAIHDKQVSLYTCGPTVYDHLHLGNWVSYIRWDTLVRSLLLDGYGVDRVMNITDVGHLVSDGDEGEDKLEKSARREGKTAWEIAELYTKDFLTGMNSLNLLPPTRYVRATEHINEQLNLIKKLDQKGFTYKITDGIYFDTAKFPTYADFAHLELSDQKAGVRIEANPEKKHPSDFALWKFSPLNEKRDMEWDSPWGKGFPGWHIECSAMAMKYLGPTLDIHTGGIDHIPVHHTNEIAQSEAASDHRLANFWLHNNFLMIDGRKISKSLGNGITLQDLEPKGFYPLDFKMFVLQSHYRSASNFTWKNLQGAKNRLSDLNAVADLRWQRSADYDLPPPLFEQARDDISNALNDDLNTPLALSYLSKLIETVSAPLQDASHLNSFLEFLDQAFGFRLLDRADINDDQKALLAKRDLARGSNDWAGADQIRQQLNTEGVALRDTPVGQVWARVS